MLDINWRDAMAVRAIAGSFTHEEREAGWPVAMQPEQLAAMQRPFLRGDVQGRSLFRALRDALQAACQGQAIACEPDVRRVMVRPAVDHVPPRTSMFGRVENWLDAYTIDGCAYAYTTPAVHQERTFYHVTAAAFAAWLAAQDMEPSQHIAAWFKTQGVGAASATAAPGVALATAGDAAPVALLDSDGMMTPAALVQWRKQAGADPSKKSKPWPKPNVQALAAWLRRERAENGQRGALTRIAKQLGYDRPQSLRALLERNDFDPGTGEEVPPPRAEYAWNGYGGKGRKTGTY